MEFYYSDSHFTTIMQGCKVVTTLPKISRPSNNLVTTLQGCSKVATTSKFPYEKVRILASYKLERL